MILIVSSAADDHTVPVVEHLEERSADFQLFDFSEFPKNLRVAIDYDGEDRDCLLLADDEIHLQDCNVIWWRRPQSFGIDESVVDPTAYRFAYSESSEAINGALLSLDTVWINHPSRDEEASRKVNHLRIAQDIGFEIPETLITNDPSRAMSFVNGHGVTSTVYKAFRALPEAWRETRVLRPAELRMLSEVELAPVIFQEYVPGEIDLRITVVGDRIFTAAIHSQTTAYPIDYRANLDEAEMEPHDLPEEIVEMIYEFMDQLGLVFGAIDMRLTPDGRYVFLEINPAGLWLFAEEPTGLPITDALVDLLIAYDEGKEESESSEETDPETGEEGELEEASDVHDEENDP